MKTGKNNSFWVALLFGIAGGRATWTLYISIWAAWLLDIMHLVTVVVLNMVLTRSLATSMLLVIMMLVMAVVLILILVALSGAGVCHLGSWFCHCWCCLCWDTPWQNVPSFCISGIPCLARRACLASGLILVTSWALPLQLELWNFGRNCFYLGGG